MSKFYIQDEDHRPVEIADKEELDDARRELENSIGVVSDSKEDRNKLSISAPRIVLKADAWDTFITSSVQTITLYKTATLTDGEIVLSESVEAPKESIEDYISEYKYAYGTSTIHGETKSNAPGEIKEVYPGSFTQLYGDALIIDDYAVYKVSFDAPSGDTVELATKGEVAEKVDKSIMQNTPVDIGMEITPSATGVSITHNKKNIVTGATSSESDSMPIANGTQVGMMTPEQVGKIEDLESRVGGLENQNVRLSYTAGTSPTEAQIRAFVISAGYTDATKWASIGVVVQGTNHIWRYYSNTELWTDIGLDTVQQASQSVKGIVQGSSVNGKVFVEADGTMSLNGYDNLVNGISNLDGRVDVTESDITALESRMATAESDISTAEGNISSLGERMTTAEGDIDDLESSKASKTEVNTALALKEDKSNKKDTVANSSSDYISGKALMQYIASGNGGGAKQINRANLNDVTATGFYYGFLLTNTPVNTNSAGHLIVIHHDLASTNYCVQIYSDIRGDNDNPNPNYIYYRKQIDGVWNSWQKIAKFSDIPSIVTAFQSTPDDTHIPSEKLVKDSLDLKADKSWELLWSDYNEHISQAAQTLLTANQISKYSEIMVKIWWSQDTLETTVKSDNNPEFGGSAIMANLKNTRILLGAGKNSQYQGWRYARINTSGDLVITNGYKEPTITTTDNTRGKIYEVWGR